MKLHLLEISIDNYIQRQFDGGGHAWEFYHSIVHTFNQEWHLTSPDMLGPVFDQSLQSDISQRWWKREQYRPKEMMLQLISVDPELALIAFKDLGNDAATLDGRLSRFEFYCDDLLQMHRRKDRASINASHQQDAGIISLYLAGMFPSKYTLYPGLKIFQSFCEVIGSPDIPKVDDLFRFMKVASIVNTYLNRHPRFNAMIEYRTENFPSVKCIPFQCSFELISHAGGNPTLENL